MPLFIDSHVHVYPSYRADRMLAAFRKAVRRHGAETGVMMLVEREGTDVFADWAEGRGLYADTVKHDTFSEHAQCLALAYGRIAPDRARRVFKGLVSAPDLARCSVYFSYYLFDTYFRFGRPDLFLKRLDLWRTYVSKDLKTPLEAPDIETKNRKDARSDCHAWGAHPLVFMQRGLAGIDSAAPFYGRVRIAPQPGGLRFIKARAPHPNGFIEEDLRFDGGAAVGSVTLPEAVEGEFVWKGRITPLRSGVNVIGN